MVQKGNTLFSYTEMPDQKIISVDKKIKVKLYGI